MPDQAAKPAALYQALQLLSHHGQTLLYLSRRPDARMRDIAQRLGLTERAVMKIVADLEDEGMLSRSRDQSDGRRYRYWLHADRAPRHPAEDGLQLTLLLRAE